MTTANAGAAMSIRVDERDGDEACVRVTGVLAVGTAHELEALLTTESAVRSRILLDLSAVDFMDSCGIRVIVRSIKLAERQGWTFAIRDELPGHVQRLLDVTGIGPFLPLAV